MVAPGDPHPKCNTPEPSSASIGSPVSKGQVGCSTREAAQASTALPSSVDKKRSSIVEKEIGTPLNSKEDGNGVQSERSDFYETPTSSSNNETTKATNTGAERKTNDGQHAVEDPFKAVHGSMNDPLTNVSSQSSLININIDALRKDRPLEMRLKRPRRVTAPVDRLKSAYKNKSRSGTNVLESVRTPLNSLIHTCATRMDIWSITDMGHILPRIGRELERKKSAMILTSDGIQLCDWCILIFLDKTKLAHELSDTSDVAQELHEYFPGLLSIQRFPTWTALREDIVQVGLKKIFMTPCRDGDRGRFQAFLNNVAGAMQFQGVSTRLGDVSAFWSGHVPADYTETPDQVDIVGKLSSAMRMFAYFSSPNIHQPFATASQYVQEPTVYNVSEGLQAAAICTACKGLKSTEKLLPMPGNTFCCQACQLKYFDICQVCLNNIPKIASIPASCEHKFCQACLVHKFNSSTQSIDDFPPQCCDKEMIVHGFLKHLPTSTIRDYMNMHERKIALKNTICATPKCEKREVKYYHVDDGWGLCAECLDLTCVRCHKLKCDHGTTEEPRQCPPSDDVQLLSLAEANNWKLCPKCRSMVSRSGGCNTMRCRCGQGFCYTCGKEFEGSTTTCGCPMTFDTNCAVEHAVADADDVADIPEWADQGVMLNCTHEETVYVCRQRCHGCLRDEANLMRMCIRCFAALCRDCRLAEA